MPLGSCRFLLSTPAIPGGVRTHYAPHARRLHFVLVILYNVYAMCILFWHFRRYVIIRHSYLTRGGWRGARRSSQPAG